MYISFKVNVEAGNHDRNYCPVVFKLAKEAPVLQGAGIEQLSMEDEAGSTIPVQWVDEGNMYAIYWIVNDLPALSTRVYTLRSEKAGDNLDGVQLVQDENKLDITIAGEYFTSYVYDPSIAKPYIGPVIGPYGDSYTRLDFEIKEHPHHRSLWLAIGDVNGVDAWNEPAGVHGKQRHQSFSELISGPVMARITSHNVWMNFKEKPLIDESRTVTIYNTPSQNRFLDMDITFKATYGKVEFGASKEAGPLGIRVAESMKVKNGGTIINSYGAIGEEECWGHRAEWCDYHGMVGGHRLGISTFDHPENEDYPTYWHIRNYGLMAPNNFYFIGGKLLKLNEVVHYQYRIYFHDGDTAAARVAEHYHDYINPPGINMV